MPYGTFSKALDGVDATAAVPKQADEQSPILAAQGAVVTTPNSRMKFATPFVVAVAVLGLAACGIALAFGGSTGAGGLDVAPFSSLGKGSSDFRAFLSYFTPAQAPGRGFQGEFDNLKIALASSKNFAAPVDLVTTGDDAALREALSDKNLFGHVNIVNFPLCGDGDMLPDWPCPGTFVEIVEEIKAAYVRQHQGENIAYFEADMVIQPGGGDVVRKALAERDFDVGYTYQPDFMTAYYDAHCGPSCGSLNSGFILWKNANENTNRWNDAVLNALYAVGGPGSFQGGENQAATDAVIAQRQLPIWSVVEPPGRGIKVISLPYQQYNFVFGTDMGDGTDPEHACCTMKENPILHFYSGFKQFQVSQCCKDLVYGTGTGTVAAAADSTAAAAAEQPQA